MNKPKVEKCPNSKQNVKQLEVYVQQGNNTKQKNVFKTFRAFFGVRIHKTRHIGKQTCENG